MQLTASLTALSALLFVLVNPTHVSAIPLGQRNVETTNDSNSTLVLSSAKYDISFPRMQKLTVLLSGTLSARVTPPPPPPPIRIPILSLPNQNAHDLTDKGYVALLKLGDGQKSFKALLDTGSADFWVPSETSTTLIRCQGGHNGIGPASSHTLQVSNAQFTVRYEDGSAVTGRVSADTLTVGRISVPAMPVGVASIVQGIMAGSRADGILGLATSRKSRMGQHTVVETLFARGAIPGLLFGLKLPRLADRNAGELSLGAPNFSKFDVNSQAVSTNTRGDGLYGIRVAGVSVNNVRIPISSAIFDSGAEAITAPPNAGGQFNHAIPGAIVQPQPDGTTLSIIPCNDPHTLASVILVTIRSKTFQIQARDLVGSFVAPIQGVNYCLSLVQDSRARSNGEWVFGIPFLKNVYSIYDEGQNSVTVARLIYDGSELASGGSESDRDVNSAARPVFPLALFWSPRVFALFLAPFSDSFSLSSLRLGCESPLSDSPAPQRLSQATDIENHSPAPQYYEPSSEQHLEFVPPPTSTCSTAPQCSLAACPDSLDPEEGESLYVVSLEIGAKLRHLWVYSSPASNKVCRMLDVILASDSPADDCMKGDILSVIASAIAGTATSSLTYENGVSVANQVVREAANLVKTRLDIPLATAIQTEGFISSVRREGSWASPEPCAASRSKSTSRNSSAPAACRLPPAACRLPPIVNTFALSNAIPAHITNWKLSHGRGGGGGGDGESGEILRPFDGHRAEPGYRAMARADRQRRARPEELAREPPTSHNTIAPTMS
ncbi:hypothetical protein EVG20_g4850 [Dentipellis fragilis]|uniref:Peptidase A1 domain-containing protein n=1 Tax=Dentipellis fragilis TaxID=205917 RepID=A0A4Y9YWX0_9AGAM|nr:hypothetical protein EVG20_g4850 [Dentipellis fragilis]